MLLLRRREKKQKRQDFRMMCIKIRRGEARQVRVNSGITCVYVYLDSLKVKVVPPHVDRLHFICVRQPLQVSR